MNDSHTALLRQGNGHVGFGDCVHGGTDDGNIQADIARELRLSARKGGHNIGAGRQQQHVIEGESLRNWKVNHNFSLGKVKPLF